MDRIKYVLTCLIMISLSVTALGVGQIDIAALPYTITKPGSYIVVCDLTTSATNVHLLSVNTSYVDIDLNGHSLTGPGKYAGTSGIGIRGGTGVGNVTIRNGTVKQFRGGGISFSRNNIVLKDVNILSNGAFGLSAIDSCRMEGCTISDNSTNGIEVQNSCSIEKCDVQRNGGFGITAGNHSNIINNHVLSNGSTGIKIGGFSLAERNDASNNGGHGISISSCSMIISNQGSNNLIDGVNASFLCKISQNATHWNQRHGIYASSDVQINDNVATYNKVDGIWADIGCSIANNLSKDNSNNGISTKARCNINNNQVGYNKWSGISTDNACQIINNTLDDAIETGNYSTVKGNTITDRHIKIYNSCLVADNHITLCPYSNASSAAIIVLGTGNRIEKNHITDNDCGIYFSSSSNWYGSNSFTNNNNDTKGTVPTNPTDYPNIYF